MKLLLDSHIFLWYISGDKRLPIRYRENIQNIENLVYLSVVSNWEIIIKYQLGKLNLPEPPEIYLPKQRHRHQIESLSLDEQSVSHLPNLPPLHNDPFDRIIICQAIVNDLLLVSVDDTIKDYPVPFLK